MKQSSIINHQSSMFCSANRAVSTPPYSSHRFYQSIRDFIGSISVVDTTVTTQSKVSLLGETYGRGLSINNHQSSITRALLFLAFILLPMVGWGADVLVTTLGFENSISDVVKNGCSSISQSSEGRTGSKSLSTSYDGTGDKAAKVNMKIAVNKNSYLYAIAYAKLESSDETTEGTGNQAATNSYVGGNGKGTYNNLKKDQWLRITSSKKASSDQTEAYVLLQRKHSAKKNVLFDDIVIYTSSSSTIDLTAPSSATAASATTSAISWTSGSDSGTGATGVQATLIFHRTGGSNGSKDLALNDQGIYSLTATEGPSVVGNWTLLSASVGSTATSYSGAFTAGDEYAIVHRDLAYNYSTPTYVVAASAGPVDPTITFNNSDYEIGSELDLSTLFTSNSKGTVTYSVKDAGTTGASVSGTTFTATTAGTATVTASQAEETGKYNAKAVDATITVKAVTPKYTLTFAAGGGTGSMTALQYVEGAEVTLPTCTFTPPTGKTFDKWTSTDVTITDGKFNMPAKAVTVTATYKSAPIILVGTTPSSSKSPLTDVVYFNKSYTSGDFGLSGGMGGDVSSKTDCRYVGFTVPDDYTAKVTIAGKGSSGRKLSLVTEANRASSTWDNAIITATMTGTSNVVSASTSTNINPGVYRVGSQGSGLTVTSVVVELTASTSTYTVTYDANNATSGTVPTDNTKYDKDASVTVKGNTGNLQKDGYTFAGWNTKNDGTGTTYSAVSPLGTFNITANTTLYAKWTPTEYDVIYYAEKDLACTTQIEGLSPSKYTIEACDDFPTSANFPAEKCKTGYNFDKWYKNNWETPPSLVEAPENGKGYYGDFELYASWTAIEYTITYANLQGTTKDAQKYTIESDDITLTDPTGEYAGYTFGGWFDGEGGTGNQVTVIAKGSYGDKTLYAKWNPIPSDKYGISRYWGSGDDQKAPYEYFTAETATRYVIENYTMPATDNKFWVGGENGWDAAFSAEAFFKDAFKLSGTDNWYLGENVSTTLVVDPTQKTVAGSNLNIKAEYTFQVAYKSDGSNWSNLPFALVENTKYETDVVTLNGGYYAGNWDMYVGTKTYKDGIYGTYFYHNKSHKGTYGEGHSNYLLKEITGLNYETGDLTGKFRIYSDSQERNWFCSFVSKLSYKLLNDDDSEFQAAQEIWSDAASKTTTFPATVPEKSGYTCIGWARTKGATEVVVAPEASYTYWKTNDVLYPVWQAKSYVITYTNTFDVTHENPATYTIESETITFSAPTGERTGYNFSAWSPASIEKGSTGNKEIAASWTAQQYTISYKDKDDVAYSGSNESALPATHTYGTATALVDGVCAGYEFNGWFTTSACDGDAITSVAADAYIDNFTLYAKWGKVYTTPEVTWTGLDDLVLGQKVPFTVATTSDDPLTVSKLTISGGTLENVAVDGKSITATLLCPTSAGKVTLTLTTAQTEEYAAKEAVKEINLSACTASEKVVYSMHLTSQTTNEVTGGRATQAGIGSDTQEPETGKVCYKFAGSDSKVIFIPTGGFKKDDKLYIQMCANGSKTEGYNLYNASDTQLKVCTLSLKTSELSEFDYTFAANTDSAYIKRYNSWQRFYGAYIKRMVSTEDPTFAWADGKSDKVTKPYGTDFAMPVTANSVGAVTYSSSDENVATIVDNQVHPVAKGEATITATIAAAGCFDEASITRKIEITYPDCEQPTITTNPQNQTLEKWDDTFSALTVVASVSDGGTLHYQWYKGDEEVGSDAASYTPSAAGSYKVVVTNTLDKHNDKSTTSTTATLTKPAAPKNSVTFAKGSESATGTTPTMEDQEVGAEITLPANPFTLVDNFFAGWKCSVDEVTYAAGSKYTMTNAATTFTAQWNAGAVAIWDPATREADKLPKSTTSDFSNLTDDFATLKGVEVTVLNAGTSTNKVSGNDSGDGDGTMKIKDCNSSGGQIIKIETSYQSNIKIGASKYGSNEGTVYLYDSNSQNLGSCSTGSTKEVKNLAAGTYYVYAKGSGKSFNFSYLRICSAGGVDDTPKLKLSSETASLALPKYLETKSVKVSLTGTNLTDGEYNVTLPSPAVEGLSINPTSFTVASGAVNQEFTLTYSATDNVTSANVNFVFTVPELSKTLAVTYGKVQGVQQTDVTASTTWDWTNAASDNITLLEDGGKNVEMVLANVDGVTNNATFNSQALKFYGEKVRATDGNIKYASFGHISFNVTTPGRVTVTFADNGKNNRRLKINDFVSESSSSSSDYKTFTATVDAGTVTLMGVKSDQTGENQYVRIQKIVFEAANHYRENLTIGNIGSVCWPYEVAPEDRYGAEFFEISCQTQEYDEAKGKVLPYKVYFDLVEGNLEAGKPYIFIPTETKIMLFNSNDEAATAPANYNGFFGTFSDITDGAKGTAGNVLEGNYIVYNNTFKLCGGKCNLNAYRAYLNLVKDGAEKVPVKGAAEVQNSPKRRVVLTGNGFEYLEPNPNPLVTEIGEVEGETNLDEPQKLLIDNQVVIIRNGRMYNAQGALLK